MQINKKLRKFMKDPKTMLGWAFINILIYAFGIPIGSLFLNWWIVGSGAFVWFWYMCQYEPPKPPMTIEQFTNDIGKMKNLDIKFSGYITGMDDRGFIFITCLKCGKTSYNGGDISNNYCAHCNKFHK